MKKRKPKATKPKPVGRDRVDVIYDFDRAVGAGVYELDGHEWWVKLPLSLAEEVRALLKKAKGLRDTPGKPPKPYPDRVVFDLVVMQAARREFKRLSGRRRAGREEALDEASKHAAALDWRPKGRALTAGAIRERLEHPGDYEQPPMFAGIAERLRRKSRA